MCLRVIQKPLLISSLVMDYFRKASAFDTFEAFCETSKTIRRHWKWQLCPERMALFSLLHNVGGMQIMPPSISYIPSFCAFRVNFSPNTRSPSCLVSFRLSQWIAVVYMLLIFELITESFNQFPCFCFNFHNLTRTQKDVCLVPFRKKKKEGSAFSRKSYVP